MYTFGIKLSIRYESKKSSKNYFVAFLDDDVADGCDNCPNVSNMGQEDADNDGVGDVCDQCSNNDDNADADGAYHFLKIRVYCLAVYKG